MQVFVLAHELAASLTAWASAAPRALVLLGHEPAAAPFDGLEPLTIRL